jgi:rhodanese-related sulfurtransferase
VSGLSVPEIDAHRAARWTRFGVARILDVRVDDEWAAGHIEGAVHLPLSQLDARIDQLQRDRPIVVVSTSGQPSAEAAARLAAAGLEVANLSDGMNAWQAAGLPVVNDRGCRQAKGLSENDYTPPGHVYGQSVQLEQWAHRNREA